MKKQRSDVRGFDGSGVREQPNARTREHPNAPANTPKVLALDFDGVICDTADETLKSTWQVYREIWDASGNDPPSEAAAAFQRMRPTLEIGWEAPVLLRAILEGVPEAALLHEFQTTWRPRIVKAYRLSPIDLAACFDAVRDAWIQQDPSGWLASQHFYPDIAARLRALVRGDVPVFIITTKEGRFAHMLLEANGVTLPVAQVWGKERARPKADLLRVLRKEQSVDYGKMWFVEDRLKTLRSLEQQADLEAVGLFLATWGYNTPGERDEAAADRRITPLTLEQFCGDLSAWPRADATDARGVAR
jgi:phosphoglycolate phosphatase-like HAD superfamily hydrolase